MTRVRPPAVAGRFYPDDPGELRSEVLRYLKMATPPTGAAPRALIVPHAGYVYSGPVAGTAYAALKAGGATIGRVVLVGPSHFVREAGLCLPDAGAFSTPLGEVEIDEEAVATTVALDQVTTSSMAHAREHSLEVQLPFLQAVLGDFRLVPFATGAVTYQEVAEVLDLLTAADPAMLVVISSDLSHYHDYETARRLDAATADAILGLRPDDLLSESACGLTGVQALLSLARSRGWSARLLDLRNSGDTAGPRDEVVGYGAFAFS